MIESAAAPERTSMAHTDGISEHRVREIAYRLWEEAGRPFGHEAEFWRRAREEVAAGARKRPAKGIKPEEKA
jgi:hypothetical protein